MGSEGLDRVETLGSLGSRVYGPILGPGVMGSRPLEAGSDPGILGSRGSKGLRSSVEEETRMSPSYFIPARAW